MFPMLFSVYFCICTFILVKRYTEIKKKKKEKKTFIMCLDSSTMYSKMNDLSEMKLFHQMRFYPSFS